MYDQVCAHFTSSYHMETKRRQREGMDRGFYCLAAMSKLGWFKIFMT